MIKFGRYPEKTVTELGGQAAILALKDAGIAIKDVEMFACGNLYQSNAMVGQRILQQIGQTGIPVINVSNACATGSTAFREAYMSVASGMYDISMAVGVEQMGKQGLLGGTGGGDPAYSTEGKVGSGLMPAVFGQAGIGDIREDGTEREDLRENPGKVYNETTQNALPQVCDDGGGALREPRSLRRRRGRQVYRRRRRDASGRRRQVARQRVGRIALEGASTGRNRRREYLRSGLASDPGRSRERSTRAERQGGPGACNRAGLGLHDSYPDSIIQEQRLIGTSKEGRPQRRPLFLGRYKTWN